MKRVDISDREVCLAYLACKDTTQWPYEYLMAKFGCSFKVAWRAMERADDHNLIDYGVSLRSGWVTDEGMEVVTRG